MMHAVLCAFLCRNKRFCLSGQTNRGEVTKYNTTCEYKKKGKTDINYINKVGIGRCNYIMSHRIGSYFLIPCLTFPLPTVMD